MAEALLMDQKLPHVGSGNSNPLIMLVSEPNTDTVPMETIIKLELCNERASI